MKSILFYLLLVLVININCNTPDEMIPDNGSSITGFQFLSDLTGHWVGSNETVFGNYDWFAFDFRPISASHLHSIYEGGTNQNIITSVFVADFEGKKQVMARNGGWLGGQYRATYFVLDRSEINGNTSYYRLVDAVGGEDRAYMEFEFKANGTLEFDAYKDNSGSLDEAIHHMGFKGTNYNPSFAEAATTLFDFPKETSEVDLNDKFTDLIDPDSALFLEEDQDPFPKSEHGHLSDLKINITKSSDIQEDKLMLYISTEPITDDNGTVDFDNVDRKVVRTVDVQASESFYTTTYLHPDTYYITAFMDGDNNLYPSSGDVVNSSKMVVVSPETFAEMSIEVGIVIP